MSRSEGPPAVIKMGTIENNRQLVVAIMPMASAKMAVSICERIRNGVEDHLFSVREGTLIGLGVSIGVASFPDDGETSEELLTASARRMQHDKHGRKAVLTVAEAGVASIDMMR